MLSCMSSEGEGFDGEEAMGSESRVCRTRLVDGAPVRAGSMQSKYGIRVNLWTFHPIPKLTLLLVARRSLRLVTSNLQSPALTFPIPPTPPHTHHHVA
jgi:hypothetical protein